jgi:hypothetical protein
VHQAAAVPITAEAAVTATVNRTVFHNNVAVSCRNNNDDNGPQPT